VLRLTSLEIAERSGVESWPVEAIDSLKAKLGPPESS
jgi:hypothetical protein